MFKVQHLHSDDVIEVHIDHLRKFKGSNDVGKAMAEIDSVQSEHVVDKIVAHKFVGTRKPCKKNIRFSVKWEGWGDQWNQWKTFDEVNELQALDEYFALHPSLPSQLGLSDPDAPLRGDGVTRADLNGHRVVAARSRPPPARKACHKCEHVRAPKRDNHNPAPLM
jgi:hypothetical protein